MRVLLIKKDKIRSMLLPEEVSGNYWVADYGNRGNKVNLMSIRALNGKWNLLGNDEIYCMNGNEKVPGFVMDYYKFYPIKNIVNNLLIQELFKYVKYYDYLIILVIILLSMLYLGKLFAKFLTKKIKISMLREED